MVLLTGLRLWLYWAASGAWTCVTECRAGRWRFLWAAKKERNKKTFVYDVTDNSLKPTRFLQVMKLHQWGKQKMSCWIIDFHDFYSKIQKDMLSFCNNKLSLVCTKRETLLTFSFEILVCNFFLCPGTFCHVLWNINFCLPNPETWCSSLSVTPQQHIDPSTINESKFSWWQYIQDMLVIDQNWSCCYKYTAIHI